MHQQIITFWFEEIDSKSWWKKDDAFDALLHERFGEVHTLACACDLWEWRKTAEGRLAEIIVLDQFSRNMYRGSPRAFAHDEANDCFPGAAPWAVLKQAYPDAVFIDVTTTSSICFSLTIMHTGQGSDPQTSPSNSPGCPNAQYVSGESISLSASPDSGWAVEGWSGTSNNGSTSSNNSLTMPAQNHDVGVGYVLDTSCYSLTLSHTGQGSDPVASPTNSPECSIDQYMAGTSIGFSADPDSSWSVIGWSGTDNNSSTSTSNTATMPGSNHSVSVAYFNLDACYAIRTLTGYAPGQDTGVGIDVTPAGGTQNYAVEDTPPDGWTVSGVSHSGNFDVVNGKVKWGPFFDTDPRSLSYTMTPPRGESGEHTLVGTAAFDDTPVEISGDRAIQ
jgi:hypothetical protein